MEDQLEQIKALLSDAETAYQHAFASGDWEAMTAHRRDVMKYRSTVGKLVKERLAQR